MQNAELKDRLAQIQGLSAGFETSRPTFAEPPRNRTPQQWAKTASINRLGSFRSLQSSMSDKFFDALDEVCVGGACDWCNVGGACVCVQ